MSEDDQNSNWICVGEFQSASAAQVQAGRLTIDGIPNRVEQSELLPRRDPRCWIWVPPERADEAKRLMATDAVPADELERIAMSYPPPDDA